MKVISKLLLSATLMSILFSSCSDDDSDKSPVAPAGNIIATVDGTSWEASGIAIIGNNSISVGGQSGGKTVQITTFKDDVVGTYEVKGIGALTTYTPEAMVAYETSGSFASASIYFDNVVAVGSVTITEIDEVNKTVSGTFHSKVKSFTDGTTAEITAGSFTKVPYTTEITTSTMSAKIDGVQFNAHVVVSANGMGTLVLNGETLGGQQIITISVPETIAVGTYTFGELGFSDQYTTYTANGKTYASVSGTLKITAHNKVTKHIEGTFTFSAEPFGFEADNVSATEGVFSINYK
jgi:hypothetical protein